MIRDFWKNAWHHGWAIAVRGLSIEAFGIDPKHPRRELPYAWLCE